VSEGRTRSRVGARSRVLSTVLGTLLVVGCEFALLDGVYDRVQPVGRAQVAVARLAGELSAGTVAPALRPSAIAPSVG
jgi:hypothetical protein